jgi:hypothetical protein
LVRQRDGSFDALQDNKATAGLKVDADLESAHVVLPVIVAVAEGGDGDTIANEEIGAAIRSCLSRHDGPLAFVDESRLRDEGWAAFGAQDTDMDALPEGRRRSYDTPRPRWISNDLRHPVNGARYGWMPSELAPATESLGDDLEPIASSYPGDPEAVKAAADADAKQPDTG